jgi:hypothetical protein
MTSSVAKQNASAACTAIHIFQPAAQEAQTVFWRINGFRTKLVIWSIEQWESLEARPTDAQYHPSGFWCALRVD